VPDARFAVSDEPLDIEVEDTSPAMGGSDPNDRWSAALAYVSILCLLPYFFRGKQPYVLFHAKQGILLFALELVASLALWLLEVTLGRIPFLGLILMVLLRLAVWLPIFGLAILGFTRALAGERLRLPWIGHLDHRVPDPPVGVRS
jgi:fumarate reductase subunit D